MKQSPFAKVLLVVLAASAVASVVLCWTYVSNTREVRSLQGQAANVNNSRAVISQLANDAMEYSKRNPAIDPILEGAGLKPGKSAPTAAPAPTPSATKPATK